MAKVTVSLSAAQREFAVAHAVGLVEKSFAAGNVFMYHHNAAFTDRWLVRLDGSAAQHDRFEREPTAPRRPPEPAESQSTYVA